MFVKVKCTYNKKRICAEEISLRIDSLEPDMVNLVDSDETGLICMATFEVRFDDNVMSVDDIKDALIGDVNKVTITEEDDYDEE